MMMMMMMMMNRQNIKAYQQTLCDLYNDNIKWCAFLPRCMECIRGLAMRILSIRLSVCQTRGLWENKKKLADFIPYERSFSRVLWEEE